MERPAKRITRAKPFAASSPPQSPPPQIAPAKASPHPGLMPAALVELRSAAATYDYLRSTGDATEFWEALRLARSNRAVEPREGSALSIPGADEEASIRQALGTVRERFSGMVGELRLFLEGTSGLPEPAERFEMALAFLMASSREHDFVSLWLREPAKHRSKAADKLRSLAVITDPYREALRPWSLDSEPSSEKPS
jgi:hypothetical protein